MKRRRTEKLKSLPTDPVQDDFGEGGPHKETTRKFDRGKRTYNSFAPVHEKSKSKENTTEDPTEKGLIPNYERNKN